MEKKVNVSEKIVAVLHKDGTYNGNEYHNYVLVAVKYVDGIPVSCDCSSYKFSKKDIHEVTGFDAPDLLVGCYINQGFFNKFGKLAKIEYDTKGGEI